MMVTMTLMLVTFGSFLLVNHLYNTYWLKLETADMLDLIADSGYFLYCTDSDVEQTIKNITEGVSPIVGIVVDSSGDIISRKVIGGTRNLVIPDSIIKKVLDADDMTYQIDRYIYSRRTLENSNTLIVIMDTSVDDNIDKKIIGTVIIIICGILALALITFYLSGYVTEPAREALLREKRFISDASHELKTPLGGISINAQALKSSEPDNLYIKNILTESDRMGRLIERLLILSKFDEGEISPKKKISLSSLVTEMSLTYESVVFEKGLAYSYNIDEGIFINGNEDEIRQLMAILIDNAVKNTEDKGGIDIECFSSNGEAVIKISNTGIGIAEDDLPNVFERFYTSDTSRSNRSFGLGLAIAKAITETHKGKISVKSVPDENTVFTVHFKTV